MSVPCDKNRDTTSQLHDRYSHAGQRSQQTDEDGRAQNDRGKCERRMAPGLENDTAVEKVERYSGPKNKQADAGPTLRKA
jgi:hypothetical protein